MILGYWSDIALQKPVLGIVYYVIFYLKLYLYPND